MSYPCADHYDAASSLVGIDQARWEVAAGNRLTRTEATKYAYDKRGLRVSQRGWLSPDPLGLGGNRNSFGFDGAPTTHVDVLGLTDFFRGDRDADAEKPSMTARTMRDGKSEFQSPLFDSSGKMTKEGRGISLFSNQEKTDKFGGSHRVTSVPEGLAIERRASDPVHYEIVPTQKMTKEEYDKKLAEVKTEKVAPLKKHEH